MIDFNNYKVIDLLYNLLIKIILNNKLDEGVILNYENQIKLSSSASPAMNKSIQSKKQSIFQKQQPSKSKNHFESKQDSTLHKQNTTNKKQEEGGVDVPQQIKVERQKQRKPTIQKTYTKQMSQYTNNNKEDDKPDQVRQEGKRKTQKLMEQRMKISIDMMRESNHSGGEKSKNQSNSNVNVEAFQKSVTQNQNQKQENESNRYSSKNLRSRTSNHIMKDDSKISREVSLQYEHEKDDQSTKKQFRMPTLIKVNLENPQQDEINQIQKNIANLNLQQRKRFLEDLQILEQDAMQRPTHKNMQVVQGFLNQSKKPDSQLYTMYKNDIDDEDNSARSGTVWQDRAIEEEHNQLLINQSIIYPASKNQFDINRYQTKFAVDDQIDEDLSEKSFDEDDLIALKLNTLMRIVHNNEDVEPNDDSSHEEQDEYIDEFYSGSNDDDDDNNDEQYFQEIKEEYYKLLARDAYKDSYILYIAENHDLSWLLKETQYYSDDSPFLSLRKFIFFIVSFSIVLSYKIVQSKYFGLYILMLTTANIILFLIYYNTPEIQTYQYIFLILYLLESLIRLCGHGIHKFYGDLWNFYDLITLVLYAIYVIDRRIIPFDVSTFRVIRIPFFLARLNKNLQIMLKALSQAFLSIMENVLLVVIFSLIVALVGLTLFQGVLKHKCMHPHYGYFTPQLCGYQDCPSPFICAKSLKNPDVPTNFDNIYFAYAQIIRTITLNDWTITMYMNIKQFHPASFIFYIVVNLIGEKFLFNLVIAVLKTYYRQTTEFYEQNPIPEPFYENQIAINMRVMKNLSLWPNLKKNIHLYKYGNLSQIRTPTQSVQSESGSLQELMNQSPANKSLFELFKQQDVKLLSARQRNLVENYKQKQREKYQTKSWIISCLFPKTILQTTMQQLVQKQEENFLYLYDLEQFYRIGSADYLCLRAAWKRDEYIIDEEERHLILVAKAERQRNRLNELICRKRLQFEYPSEKYVSECHSERQRRVDSGVRLPLNDGRRNVRESEDSLVLSAQMRVQQIEEEKEQQQMQKVRIQRQQSKTFKRRSQYYKSQKFTFDQQLSMALHIEQEQEEHTNKFKLEGQERNYNELQALINLPIESNNAVDDEDDEQQYKDHRAYGVDSDSRIILDGWCGEEVMLSGGRYVRFKLILETLNSEVILQLGWMGMLLRIRGYLRSILRYSLIQIFFDALVFVNTIILSLEGFIDEDIGFMSDLVVNITLLLELLLKVVSINDYFGDVVNVMEGVLIFVATTDKVLQLISMQVEFLVYLRVLKALLFFRVFKYNVFANNMICIARRTLASYVNMALLLFFLILNYALLGMQIFGGKFPRTDATGLLHSFSNALNAWVSVFDVSTNDDWYGLLILGTTYSSVWQTLIFLMTMIVIINYLTFGLLMAIILDAFNKYLNDADEVDVSMNGDSEQQQQQMDSESTQKSVQDVANNNIIINSNNNNNNSTTNNKNQQKEQSFTLKSLVQHLVQRPDEERYLWEVKCKQSLFIFPKNSSIRRMCYKLVEDPIFIMWMYFMLCSSLILMIVQPFRVDDDEQQIIKYLEIIINAFILLDGIMKIIAFGAYEDTGSYLHNLWRTIDFIYVTFYFLLLAPIHIPQLKFIHLLKYLRPIKLLTQLNYFQFERDALQQSIGDIISIILVLLMFWFVFAIFGMNIFKGKMGFCQSNMNFNVNMQQCQQQNLQWIIFKHNFENIFESLQTLFILSTFDGWGGIMFICINSNTADYGPSHQVNALPTYIFFVVFQFVGSLFFLGFFAGILFINYKQNRDRLLNPDLTQDQEQFIKISNKIMTESPNYSDPPRTGLRLKARQILENRYYGYLPLTMLILNIIVLGLFDEQAQHQFLHNLNYAHHGLSLVFLLDTLLKLFSLHIVRYFGEPWRRIEFLFSFLALIDFYLDMQFHWFSHYINTTRDQSLYIPLRLFSVQRVLRLLLIIQSFLGIQRLLHVIRFSFESLMKTFALFFFAISVYAYLGQYLFGSINRGQIIDDSLNFNTFFNSYLALFKCSTKNGWRNIMADCTHYNPYCSEDPTQCGQTWMITLLYFFSFIVVSNFTLLNLFINALVDQFERFYDSQNNVIETYIENIDKFRNTWCKYSQEFQGIKMHSKFICHFLLDLGEPLGSQKGDNIWDAAKHVTNFSLRADQLGYVHFREILYETVRFTFKQQIFTGTQEGQRQIKIHDKKIRYRLFNLRVINYRHHIIYYIRRQQIKEEMLYIMLLISSLISIYCRSIYTFIWCLRHGSHTHLKQKQQQQHIIYQFMQAAQSADDSVMYSEKDINNYFSSSASSDDDHENQRQEQDMFQRKRRPTKENLRRPTDVYLISHYQQQPKFRLKISYLDRIFQQKVKDNIIFVPGAIERKPDVTPQRKRTVAKVEEKKSERHKKKKPQQPDGKSPDIFKHSLVKKTVMKMANLQKKTVKFQK